MNAKQYLKQAYRLNDRIKDKEERIADLKETASSLGSIDYSKDIVQTSSAGEAAFVHKIMMIIELEEKLQADVNRLSDLKIEINLAIDEMTDVNCSLLLSKRYLLTRNWEQIAEEMNYSVVQIHRIHKRALQVFLVPSVQDVQNEVI